MAGSFYWHRFLIALVLGAVLRAGPALAQGITYFNGQASAAALSTHGESGRTWYLEDGQLRQRNQADIILVDSTGHRPRGWRISNLLAGRRGDAILALNDGCVAVHRIKESDTQEGLLVTSLSNEGQVLWSQALADISGRMGNLMQLTSGNVVVWTEHLILALSPNGSLLWSKSAAIVNGTTVINIQKVAPTADGGFVVVGNSQLDAILARYDGAGNLLWLRRWRGEANLSLGYPLDVAVLPNQQLALLFYTKGTFGQDEPRAIVLRLWPDGRIRQVTNILRGPNVQAYANYGELAATPDGRLSVLTLLRNSFSSFNSAQPALIQLDTADAEVRTLRFSPRPDSILQMFGMRYIPMLTPGRNGRVQLVATSNTLPPFSQGQGEAKPFWLIWPKPEEPPACGMDTLSFVSAKGSFPESQLLNRDPLPAFQANLRARTLQLEPVELCPLLGCNRNQPPGLRLFNLDHNFCVGQPISIELRPTLQGSRFIWSTGATTPTIVATAPGNYWVRVEGACGTLVDTTRIRTYQDSTPTLMAALGPLPRCEGEAVELIATGPPPLVWSDGFVGPSRVVDRPGTYFVQGTGTQGCRTLPSDSVTVRPFPPPIFPDVGQALRLCEGDSGQMRAPALPGLRYRWLPGTDLAAPYAALTQVRAVHRGPNPQQYEVRPYTLVVTDTAGCQATAQASLTVVHRYALAPNGLPECNPVALVIPNVITPGQTGGNDTFRIPGLDYYEQPALQIYNRWGRIVFEQQPYRQQFDGGGQPAGVYYYHLTVPEIRQTFRGWLEILR